MGLGGGGEGRLDRGRVHRGVDVRAQREGLAPVAHGAGRIEALGLLERADRRLVVEGVGEAQALVEVSLRLLVRRRDRIGEIAEEVPERRASVLCRGLALGRIGHGGEEPRLEELGPRLAVDAAQPSPDVGRVEELGGPRLRGGRGGPPRLIGRDREPADDGDGRRQGRGHKKRAGSPELRHGKCSLQRRLGHALRYVQRGYFRSFQTVRADFQLPFASCETAPAPNRCRRF